MTYQQHACFRSTGSAVRGLVAVLLTLAPLEAQTNTRQEGLVTDNFSGYNPGVDLDSTPLWQAGPPGAVKTTSPVGEVRMYPSLGQHAWFRAEDNGTLVAWPFDMVYRRFTTLEFDVLPVFVNAPVGHEAWFSVYFAPEASPAASPGTMLWQNPVMQDNLLAACRLVATLKTGNAIECRAEY